MVGEKGQSKTGRERRGGFRRLEKEQNLRNRHKNYFVRTTLTKYWKAIKGQVDARAT
jgi:hypothetical protein